MNKKTKKKIAVLRKRLANFKAELAGEKKQTDNPELIPVLEEQIAAIEKELLVINPPKKKQ